MIKPTLTPPLIERPYIWEKEDNEMYAFHKQEMRDQELNTCEKSYFKEVERWGV